MKLTSRREAFACLVVVSAVWLGCDRRVPEALREVPHDYNRWEKAIATFEQTDREDPPPENAVLFAGSSSIVRWDLKKSFPSVATINRGFGGSEIADSTHFAPRAIFKCKPGTIVFYAGDNDIANGKTAEQVHGDFRAFVAEAHRGLPRTRIIFLAIKPSRSRWRFVEEQKKANALIERSCGSDDRLIFVDTFQPMLGDDRLPRQELFEEDQLHLNQNGYEVWNSLVRPLLK